MFRFFEDFTLLRFYYIRYYVEFMEMEQRLCFDDLIFFSFLETLSNRLENFREFVRNEICIHE